MDLDEVTPPTAGQMSQASGISKTAASDWRAYCRSSRTKFGIVKRLLDLHYPADRDVDAVLDWGCAAGGVAILMDHHLAARVSAADVDRHAIAWLRASCPTLDCHEVKPAEPLPFDDASFDLIYGISVLTHIPPGLQSFYLAELRRITRDGGLVMLTVLGERACALNRDGERSTALHPRDVAELRREGILYARYREAVLDSMAFSRDGASDYGVTYHSDACIRQLFSGPFEIVEVDASALRKQDVVVARAAAGAR